MNSRQNGKPIETQQHRAAESRWSAMTKEQRSAEMSRVRRKGIKKSKRVARRSNDKAVGSTAWLERPALVVEKTNETGPKNS